MLESVSQDPFEGIRAGSVLRLIGPKRTRIFFWGSCKWPGLKNMAGTARLELATSAVTVQRPEVTSCNLTAPIATFGALRNPREVLLHPNRTQIFARRSCQENALANNFLFRAVVRTK